MYPNKRQITFQKQHMMNAWYCYPEDQLLAQRVGKTFLTDGRSDFQHSIHKHLLGQLEGGLFVVMHRLVRVHPLVELPRVGEIHRVRFLADQ